MKIWKNIKNIKTSKTLETSKTNKNQESEWFPVTKICRIAWGIRFSGPFGPKICGKGSKIDFCIRVFDKEKVKLMNE